MKHIHLSISFACLPCLKFSVIFELHFKSRGQNMEELTIGEVGRRAGINTSTVRFYERIGLLPRSKRVNKHRRFEPEVLQKLELIHFAQESGFTLAEIKELFHGFEPNTPPAARWLKLASEKLTEVDALIARAQ